MKFLLLLLLGFVANAQDPAPCSEPDYRVEPLGQSTQFRIYDACNEEKVIKVKMDGLTEYDGTTHEETTNKVSTFASSKGWSFAADSNGNYGELQEPCEETDGLGGACLVNTFTCPETCTQVEGASVVIKTIFAVEDLQVTIPHEPPNDDEIIEVTKDSVKMNIEIYGWPYVVPTGTNYLELCISVATSHEGIAHVDSIDTAVCVKIGDDDEEIGVDVSDVSDESDGEVLRFCYTFDECNGDIKYDPIYTLIPDQGNTLSVCVLFVAVALSLLSV